ncbi:8-oxo-dGTP pyrophosphatase MutT (NUDIX family) [Fontibacillus solani]|uniref:8-oxo-dGTP pyrophosphatase MutT (NUDIX family) n=1 Tax=Fontibacillus solani TaxID=1572857 RepID=A0A7W3SXD2_9BACL|nr:8-oxo-dGTP pyrophosphatase MutT (NUDIX family) [Fontibacillus solani]
MMKKRIIIFNISFWLALLTIILTPGKVPTEGASRIEYGFPFRFFIQYQSTEWFIQGVGIQLLYYFLDVFIVYGLINAGLNLWNRLKPIKEESASTIDLNGGISKGYISELRKSIGTRPIILTGVTVIVLNNKNEILLQRRSDSGDWGTIGGALELAETFEEAAHRELYEEAGLRTNNLQYITLLSGKDMYYQYPHGDEVYNALVVYETKDTMGIPEIQDDEGLELKYFSLEQRIEGINKMAEVILRKSGYISWV